MGFAPLLWSAGEPRPTHYSGFQPRDPISSSHIPFTSIHFCFFPGPLSTCPFLLHLYLWVKGLRPSLSLQTQLNKIQPEADSSHPSGSFGQRRASFLHSQPRTELLRSCSFFYLSTLGFDWLLHAASLGRPGGPTFTAPFPMWGVVGPWGIQQGAIKYIF